MIIGEAGQAAQALWGDAFESSAPVYGGGGQSGQFKMDPEELAAVISQWEDVLDKITEDGHRIERLIVESGTAPGEDPASGSFASTSSDSIVALYNQNVSMRKYAQDYIKKLKEAQSKTMVTDQDLSDTFKA